MPALSPRKTVCLATALLALGGALALGVTAPGAMTRASKSTTPTAKISPLDLRRVLALSGTTPSTIPALTSLPVSGPSVYVPLQIEFASTAARLNFRPPEGITLFHEFERFADAFLDVNSARALQDLQAMADIVWIDVDLDIIRVPPPPRPAEDRSKARAAEKVVKGGLDGLTGKGVIVAVIDDGIDFRHKDFIRHDSEGKPVSRLLHYWDTYASPRPGDKLGTPAPFSYPNGAPIGLVYSQDELTAELRAPTGKIFIQGSHGTPCTGVAAGNGNSRSDKRYVGVAPDADLIVVRIGGNFGPWNQFLLATICDWLDGKAGDRPLVVSCSFGHPQQGGRDGCRVTERQLDARFSADRKGRAICIAAGNEARLGEGSGYHGEASFQGENERGVLTWHAALGTGGRVTIYVNTDAPEDIDFSLKGSPAPEAFRYHHPLSDALVIEVGQKAGPTPAGFSSGSGQIELWSKGRKKSRADAYIDMPAWFSGSFRDKSLSSTGLLRTPGSMLNAITVGSYDFNAIDDRDGTVKTLLGSDRKSMRLGDLSSYSSPGYARNGVVKPTLAAPGQYFIAPASRAFAQDYQLFNGTSAATPYTAGVLALLLQKKPNLTFGQIKQLLRTHATANAVTGRTPNPRWGYGQFDYRAARAVFDAVR